MPTISCPGCKGLCGGGGGLIGGFVSGGGGGGGGGGGAGDSVGTGEHRGSSFGQTDAVWTPAKEPESIE